MAHKDVVVERLHDVGIIRLNHPDTLNAVTEESIAALDSAFDDLKTSTRAIVLTSEGRGFSSRMKLGKELGDDLGRPLETRINPLLNKLRNMPIPWIAAVRGPAAGVGCSLALAADMIVASNTAYFLQVFVRIGLIPDGGSFHMLVRAIGRVRALEMMMLGEKITAAQALEWGLINRVVPDDTLETEAHALVARLAKGPTRTLGVVRQMAWAATDLAWEPLLSAERAQQNIAGRSLDAREGIAAFLEKRQAGFIGA